MAKSELEEALDYFTEKAKNCGMTLIEYIKATTPTQEQLEMLIDRNKKIKERCVKMKDDGLNTLKEIADELREKTPRVDYMEEIKRQEDEKRAKKEKFEREYPKIDEHEMNIEAEYKRDSIIAAYNNTWPRKTTTIEFENDKLALVLLAFHFYKAKMFTEPDHGCYLKEQTFNEIFKSVRDQIIEADPEAIDYLGEYLSVNTLDEKEIIENS